MIDLLKITEGNQPSNIPAYEVDLNNGGWTIIIILISIVIALTIILCVKCSLLQNKINSLKKLLKNELNNKEIKMVITYRELNNDNKTVIDNAFKTLTKDDNENQME